MFQIEISSGKTVFLSNALEHFSKYYPVALSILTPAQDTQAIYHGRMRICADHAIGI